MSRVCKLLVMTFYLYVLLDGRIHRYVICHILTATRRFPYVLQVILGFKNPLFQVSQAANLSYENKFHLTCIIL